jgi:hypothetical protein
MALLERFRARQPMVEAVVKLREAAWQLGSAEPDDDARPVANVLEVRGISSSRAAFVFERRGTSVEIHVDGGKVRQTLRDSFGECGSALEVACARGTFKRLQAALADIGEELDLVWCGPGTTDRIALPRFSTSTFDFGCRSAPQPDLGTWRGEIVVAGPPRGVGAGSGRFAGVTGIEVSGVVWLFSVDAGWVRHVRVRGIGMLRLYGWSNDRWAFRTVLAGEEREG